MKQRRVSEEERRQREKEEESRRRLQEQAYQETRRGVYARILQEQDAMPDDYEQALQDEINGRAPVIREPAPPPPRKKRTGRKVLVSTLLVLLALVVAALAAHAALVQHPEVPQPVQQDTPEEDTLEAPKSAGEGRRDNVFTFLLVGRDDGGGGNTDTIMAVCFDAGNGSLDVLSIFRDTLVDVPWEIKKINSVYNQQGIEGLQTQVKNLLGYQPDYYVVLELSALTELVDALGGFDFEVPYNMDYDDPVQDLHIHLQKGMQHLNGEDAVKLLRWRKNNSGESISVGDVGRVEIQHAFLGEMARQTLKLENIGKLSQIASILDKKMKSNLNYSEMLWFGEQALKLNQDSVRFHSLPGDYTGTIWSPTYRNYQSYVFVNNAALLELVNQYMNPFEEPITEDMQHIIHGTTVETESTLPVSTGLPVTPQQTEEEGVELPAGGSLVGAPLPADANRPSVSEQPARETVSNPTQPAPSLPVREEPAEEETDNETLPPTEDEEPEQITVVEGPVVPDESEPAPVPEPETSVPVEETHTTESQ